MFLFRKKETDVNPYVYTSIVKKLYKDSKIENLNDIKKNAEAYIFHGVIRNRDGDGEDKHVLVKVLISSNPRAKAVFEKESALYSRFSHDNLIRKEFSKKINFGYNIGKKKCIVLEYIDGFDLELIINNYSVTNQHIPQRTAIDITTKILSALHEVHNLTSSSGEPLKLVHADVSPHNILISKKGQVKLIDFGISITNGEQQRIQKRVIAGKASYMAPEQFKGKDFDHRADIYAMGKVLAEMLLATKLQLDHGTDDSVCENGDSHQISQLENSDIDYDLKEIIFKALQRDPQKRFQTALEMIRQLEEYNVKKNNWPRMQETAELVNKLYGYLENNRTVIKDEISDEGFFNQTEIKEILNFETRPESEHWKPKRSIKMWSSVSLGAIVAVLLFWHFLGNRNHDATQTAQIQINATDNQPVDLSATVKKEVPLVVEEKQTTTPTQEPLVPEISWKASFSIASQGATIIVKSDKEKWSGTNQISISDLVFAGKESQDFDVIISRKDYVTKHTNFTLDPQKASYTNTFTLKLAEFGMLEARSDDFVSYTIPGYTKDQMGPFDLKLPEGVHRVTVKGFDEKDKPFTLSKRVTIGPNKTTRCIAYVQSGKRRVECE